MLRVILAEAELELAPAEIAGHPAVRASAKDQERKPGEVLLDQNLHSQAINKLPDGKRRGRPDIVHYTLLTLLESPINKGGGLEVCIHTRHNLLLRIRSDTRLPRGEARFQGLIGKVLREGRTQDKDPLIWFDSEATPAQVLQKFAKGPIVRLDEGGANLTPLQLVEKAVDGDLTLVLGAFPAGDFTQAWKTAAPDTVSIWPQALNAWAVAAELSSAFRARWGPTEPKPTLPPPAKTANSTR